MIPRYLLLLLCLGPILARATNNCICRDYVIDVNQTEGMLKMPSSACGGTMCTFKILPKDGQIVTVNFLSLQRYFNVYYFLKVFYYNGEKEEKDMIYVTDITELNHRHNSPIQSPKNFGIYINFTANSNISFIWIPVKFARLPSDEEGLLYLATFGCGNLKPGGKADAKSKHQLQYSSFVTKNQADYSKLGGWRATATHRDSVRYNCPSPYFKAELEPQVIDPTFWPSSGCAVRFSADWEAEIHSIQVFLHCNTSKMVENWKRAVNPIGISEHISREQEEERKREEGASEKEIYKDIITARQWEVMTKDFEMFMVSDVFSFLSRELYRFDGKIPYSKFCHLKYFSTTTDPCVCPTYNTTVYFDQPLNLTSPGYPSLNCPGIICNYRITMGEKKSADYNTVFIITASHIPQSTHDTLVVASASHTFKMDSNRERNQFMTIFEESFNVGYAGSSSMVENHGFSMKIEAIKLPKDCACPAGELPRMGNFSLTMPSHCLRISCHYEILQKYMSEVNLRVHLTYRLPDASELLAFDVGDRTVFIPGGASDWEHDAFTIFVPQTSYGKITANMHYIRKESEERDGERGEMESSFSMSWEWLSADDCSCGLKEMTATAEKWSVIFSPYWPGQYCSNLNCTTKIYAPEGHRIIFNFTEFETEASADGILRWKSAIFQSADFVTIYENFNKTKVLTRLSGRLARQHGEVTNSNEAIFNFKTDSQGEARGFKVMFIAVPKEPKSSSVVLWVGLCLVVLIVAGLVGYKRKFLFENVVLFARRRGINLTNPIFSETYDGLDNQ